MNKCPICDKELVAFPHPRSELRRLGHSIMMCPEHGLPIKGSRRKQKERMP